MSLGTRIKEARKSKKLSRKELAKLINASETAIKRWETGENTPTGEKILELMKVLKVDANYLYQDGMQTQALNSEEHEVALKYRRLDKWGKDYIQDTLNRLLTRQDELNQIRQLPIEVQQEIENLVSQILKYKEGED